MVTPIWPFIKKTSRRKDYCKIKNVNKNILFLEVLNFTKTDSDGWELWSLNQVVAISFKWQKKRNIVEKDLVSPKPREILFTFVKKKDEILTNYKNVHKNTLMLQILYWEARSPNQVITISSKRKTNTDPAFCITANNKKGLFV
mgnify:CR=1 FL=1